MFSFLDTLFFQSIQELTIISTGGSTEGETCPWMTGAANGVSLGPLRNKHEMYKEFTGGSSCEG